MISDPIYIGRFAPSPTGELHQGSLLTAVASFLDAHLHKGKWFVRMEDLDPPREQPGAADNILRCLEAHGLLWDDAVIYQSQRSDFYEHALSELQHAGIIYPCNCTRQRLKGHPIYDGHCRHLPPQQKPYALRITTPPENQNDTCFTDLIQGPQSQNLSRDVGDFVVQRKDSLYAYQLAVVVDDIEQRITHVVRGCDLLDSTPRQLYLFDMLGAPPPAFGHLPIITNELGQKLSKQTFAKPLDPRYASHNLFQALQQLRQSPPQTLAQENIDTQLSWALKNWSRDNIPKVQQLPTKGNL